MLLYATRWLLRGTVKWSTTLHSKSGTVMRLTRSGHKTDHRQLQCKGSLTHLSFIPYSIVIYSTPYFWSCGSALEIYFIMAKQLSDVNPYVQCLFCHTWSLKQKYFLACILILIISGFENFMAVKIHTVAFWYDNMQYCMWVPIFWWNMASSSGEEVCSSMPVSTHHTNRWVQRCATTARCCLLCDVPWYFIVITEKWYKVMYAILQLLAFMHNWC
jgi:hypothetical protein